MTTTRSEHMQWCKDRALEYVDEGDFQTAFASMMSDLQKHELTFNHPAMQIGILLLANGHLDSEKQMRDFITGFN